jgi:hypothetical protein
MTVSAWSRQTSSALKTFFEKRKKERKKTIAKDPPGLGHKDITRPDNQNLHTNY